MTASPQRAHVAKDLNEDRMTLNTLYFSKRFLSGVLKGLTVAQSATGSPRTLRAFRIGTKGRDIFTKSRYVIVDASHQNYAR